MPGMEGYEVAERIRHAVPQGGPAILILSSSPSAADARRADELGIFRQLSKPLRRGALLDTILQALGGGPCRAPKHGSGMPHGAARRLSILLVEDNAVNQKFGMRVVEKMGHQVTLAANGQLAVDAIRSRQFDLILMDIQMPVLSGIDATRAIREWETGQSRRTPIIAMTAHAMTGDADKFLDLGMDGYVSKPIQIGILRAEIDRLTQAKITLEGSAMKESIRSSDVRSVDWDELLARVDNDRELLSELISIFKKEFPGLLQTLRDAVVRNDAAQVAAVSHALKGMLSNLAVTNATDSAGCLERFARAGELTLLAESLTAFEKDVEGLLPEMELHMAEARL
jgi:CheY-like chemotaxis protein/HPt (histidine-containing phosphotransfer) domain-containing protein